MLNKPDIVYDCTYVEPKIVKRIEGKNRMVVAKGLRVGKMGRM